MVSERDTELRNAQEQSSKLQTELSRLRQDLQDNTSQEEGRRQQMSEKEEKTRKTFVMAKQKISQLMGKQASPQHKYQWIAAFMRSFIAGPIFGYWKNT